jgi:hypothetical protein
MTTTFRRDLMRLCRWLAKRPQGATAAEIAAALELPPTRVRRLLACECFTYAGRAQPCHWKLREE